MFQQIQFSNWSSVIGLIAFLVSFAIFIAIIIGTIRCSKKKIQHMENLPLDDENKKS